MDGKTLKLIKKYPVFKESTNNKVACTLTNHEVPATFDAINQYIKSRKFQHVYGLHKLADEHGNLFDGFDTDDKFVVCKLTGRKVAKKPEDIQRYLSGQKLKNAIKKAEEEMIKAQTEDEDKDESAGEEDSDESAEDDDVEDSDADEENGVAVDSDDAENIASDENEDIEMEEEPPKKALKRKMPPLRKTPTGRAKKKHPSR